MPKRIRVLWLIKGLGTGGAEKLLEMSLNHLDRETFEYRAAYFLKRKDMLVPRLEKAGVPVFCLNIDKPYNPGALWKIFRILRQEKIDVLHIHSPYPAVLGRIAGRLAAVKAIVYTEHSVVERYHPVTKLGNYLTYQLNDAIIAISHAVSDSIKKWKTARGRKVYTIYNGVDYQAIQALATDPVTIRQSLGIDPRHLVVGTVGNIRPEKGHRYFVEAVRQVMDKYPEVTFVIVGGEKFEGGTKELEELAKELGVRERIIFTGLRPDAIQLMAGFDIFVLPSIWEGFGIVCVEAMAQGKPVIGTRVGGVPEVVRDGVNGYLVEPRNPTQLAEKIIQLLTDETMRRVMGEKGRQIVKEKFDIKMQVSQIERIYATIISEKCLSHKAAGGK
jgi:glycosyltransferase involved in cell wall biosynthesis